ncbi:hypothetical protein BH23ACT9_BH23ACT9_14530 [soil metagenome]
MDPASRLRSARLAAGLTQAALADRVGLGRVTVTRYETRAVMPAADTYRALIAACRTPDRAPLDEHDRALLDAQLARSPEARLHASHELSRLRVAAARG